MSHDWKLRIEITATDFDRMKYAARFALDLVSTAKTIRDIEYCGGGSGGSSGWSILNTVTCPLHVELEEAKKKVADLEAMLAKPENV